MVARQSPAFGSDDGIGKEVGSLETVSSASVEFITTDADNGTHGSNTG